MKHSTNIQHIIGGKEEHLLERAEIQEKLARLDFYKNRVNQRIQELDRFLKKERDMSAPDAELINNHLRHIKLKSQQETEQ